MSETTVRPARAEDAEALTRLYNHYVESSPATFDIEPHSVAQRAAWISHYAERGRHRLLVAVEGGTLLGYASTSRLRERAAYATSVETTIYVDPAQTGRGLGVRLYAALFAEIEDEDVHRAYAGITLPNPASIALHRRFGFEAIGTWDEVGRKFGRYWSVQWYERRLGGGAGG